MIPYNRDYAGQVLNFSPPDTLVSTVDTRSGFRNLAVTNGNVSGNFEDPNPFSFRLHSRVFDQARFRHYRQGYPDLISIGPDAFWGHPDPFGWTTSTTFPELLETSLARVMGQVRGGNQVVVDLAEGASTVAMFRKQNAWNERVSEILGIIHGQIKRRRKYFERLDKRDRLQRILDFATSRWLEARYGWYPVTQSLYDALDTLHKENLEMERELVGTAKRTVKGSYPSYYSTFIGTLQGKHTYEATERCRLVCKFYTPGAGIWDWTSLNPSVIAWELLPLSFVVDWFVTVGQSLEYLENWLLWKNQFRGGYVTYSAKGSELTQLTGSLVSGDQYRIDVYTRGSGSSSFKNRQILTELPLPYPPRIRVNLNAMRYMDATSLIATALRKRIRFGVS